VTDNVGNPPTSFTNTTRKSYPCRRKCTNIESVGGTGPGNCQSTEQFDHMIPLPYVTSRSAIRGSPGGKTDTGTMSES